LPQVVCEQIVAGMKGLFYFLPFPEKSLPLVKVKPKVIAVAQSVAPDDEHKAAAGLESHDEKFQTREREKAEPLIRF